ncbi:MAG: hypothetical protein DRP62_00270 [Planctomycetota bacterium]|nr:MAG: hypothetical protein DRP62_00270 [Planctomycetota bacterium]
MNTDGNDVLPDTTYTTRHRIMARKRIKVSRRMLFAWFILGGFILLFTPQSVTNKFQFAFANIFRWPLSIGRGISLSVSMRPATGGLTNPLGTRENQYQNHIANLQEQLRQEHRKLEELSGLRSRFAFEGAAFVLADISRTVTDGSHAELFINRGENDGLAKGQFVMADNSIIGTISDISPRMAKVRLITDSDSKIEVKIAGANRLMEGIGNNSAKIRQLLRKKHKVKIGDNVFAIKKPGLLDAPMITAKVARCERDDENPLGWDITVEPACEIETIKDVAVIVMNPQK